MTAPVKFKSAAAQQPDRSPLVHLASAVAVAGRRAARVGPFDGIASDPLEARSTFPRSPAALDLRTLLVWTWERGVPVLPMAGSGGFAAAGDSERCGCAGGRDVAFGGRPAIAPGTKKNSCSPAKVST